MATILHSRYTPFKSSLTVNEPCNASVLYYIPYIHAKSAQERATRVRACNYVKIETGWNFSPVLKIVRHTAQAA